MGASGSAKKWVCVFCASAAGAAPAYLEAARELGRRIAERGYGLAYGGATVGAMGAVADAALAAGGEVIGVIPDVIREREIDHKGLTELHVVRTMHERKAMLAERADAFVALPGGYGTMDEFIEIVTWAQLKIHARPCVLVNVNRFLGWVPGVSGSLRRGGVHPGGEPRAGAGGARCGGGAADRGADVAGTGGGSGARRAVGCGGEVSAVS